LCSSEDPHETGASVGYGLVGLHAAAALSHHFLRRDDTLRRMLPG
jgi:superoxide oxidase